MPTNFPGGFDTFNEPSIPEETTLSSAGTGSRNHPEHHRDLGDAIEAIEHNVSLKDHNHAGGSGDHDTPQLDQANTHGHPDTDSGSAALHHTLGSAAGQAAPGNHVHPAYVVNYQICTSTTRPASPFLGLQIFETDTGAIRIWAQFPPAGSPSWRVLPMAMVPIVRLRQSAKQKLFSNGTIMEWQEELEDPFGFFDKTTSLTNIRMKEAGLYQIEATVQWDPFSCPDTGLITLCVNGVETTVRSQQYLRGGTLYQPGFSQTLMLAGKLRFNPNDVLTAKIQYVVPTALLNDIFSFFDVDNKVNSRIDITYLSP